MLSRSRKPLLYELEEAPHSSEATSAPEGPIYKDDGLLTIAGPIIVVCYGLMFGIAGLTFFGSGQALFVVSISTVFAFLYFAIPVTLLRIRAARDGRWERDAAKARDPMVEIGTGSIHRWEAIVQIVEHGMTAAVMTADLREGHLYMRGNLLDGRDSRVVR